MGDLHPGYGPNFRGCTGMKPWMKPFVAQCVASITDPAYRRRLEGELTDHLEELAATLEQSGLTHDAARERALEEMGDPEKLREAYRQAWISHSQSLRSILQTMAAGWCWMAGGYILVVFLLGLAGFGYDSGAYPIQGHPGRLLMYAGVLFLIPFSAGALRISRGFPLCRHSGKLVTVGLLAGWLAEKMAVMVLSSWIYGIPLWSASELLARIHGGGDPTAPWFTPTYILGTLVGCLLLGSAFGQKNSRGTLHGCKR